MTEARTVPARTGSRLALVAAGVTVLLWASAFVGIRAVGADFSPGALALGRLLVASAVLTVLVLIRGVVIPRGRTLLLVIAYGVLWFGAYNVALNAAEQSLDAGTTALLVNVGPILIAVFAGWLLKEGFAPRLFVGLSVALSGAIVIAAASGGDRRIDLLGVLLCLVAAVCYAVGVVAQKPVMAEVPALQATWLGCLVGMVVCLPFGPTLWAETAQSGTGSILGVVYLGIFPTAIAFTTWAYALARTPAGQLGVTTYLVPLVATLMSLVVLDEVPPVISYIGGALCLVGVAISRWRPRRATRPTG